MTNLAQEPACSCLSTDARECCRWRHGINFSDIEHEEIEPCDCPCHAREENA